MNDIRRTILWVIFGFSMVMLWDRWQISNDRLIRTTDPHHRRIVEQFFARVEANGDIVEGRQQGWYCVACEEFKDDPHEAQDPECPTHRCRWSGAMR